MATGWESEGNERKCTPTQTKEYPNDGREPRISMGSNDNDGRKGMRSRRCGTREVDTRSGTKERAAETGTRGKREDVRNGVYLGVYSRSLPPSLHHSLTRSPLLTRCLQRTRLHSLLYATLAHSNPALASHIPQRPHSTPQAQAHPVCPSLLRSLLLTHQGQSLAPFAVNALTRPSHDPSLRAGYLHPQCPILEPADASPKHPSTCKEGEHD